MEDIMVVWDIAHDFGVVNVSTWDMGEVFVSKDNYDREQARARLQQISEMTSEEFRAECEEEDAGEGEDTEEEETNDEESDNEEENGGA